MGCWQSKKFCIDINSFEINEYSEAISNKKQPQISQRFDINEKLNAIILTSIFKKRFDVIFCN